MCIRLCIHMYIVHASFKLEHSLWTMTILAWMQSPTQHVRTPHRLFVPVSDTHAQWNTHKCKQEHTFARTHSSVRHQSMPICPKHPHTSTHINTPWRTHHHTFPPAQGTWDTSGKKKWTRGTATMHTDRMLRHFLTHRNRGRRWAKWSFWWAKDSGFVYTWLPLFHGHLAKNTQDGRKWSGWRAMKSEVDAANRTGLCTQIHSTILCALFHSTSTPTSPRYLHGSDHWNSSKVTKNLALFNNSTFATTTNSWAIF